MEIEVAFLISKSYDLTALIQFGNYIQRSSFEEFELVPLQCQLGRVKESVDGDLIGSGDMGILF